MLDVQARFMNKVEPEPMSGCWLWVGATYTSGYGHFKFGKTTTGAHRVSWQLFRGEIPDGLHVLHKCDVKGCVRPSHLFLGTPRDNLSHASRRGLLPSGDSHYTRTKPWLVARGNKKQQSRLTEDIVREIRESAETSRILAKRIGVSDACISLVRNRKTWRHVQ